jgi:hypothetical protein
MGPVSETGRYMEREKETGRIAVLVEEWVSEIVLIWIIPNLQQSK